MTRFYQLISWVLTRFRIEKRYSWLVVKPCFTKYTSLKRKKVFLDTCSGRMLIWKKLTDYESSSGCCNYALQRAALDNVSSYSKEATITLLRGFYVNDMLKSVLSVRDAQRLIQEVTDLCKTGGFKLTKFISNKEDPLFQIPHTVRRTKI